MPANATTTIRARATKSGQTASACSSTSVAYTNDSTAPGLVTLTSVTPASPNSSTTPAVKGTAEAGSTVKLYTTAGCTGTPAATGTAAAFASPGLTVTVARGQHDDVQGDRDGRGREHLGLLDQLADLRQRLDRPRAGDADQLTPGSPGPSTSPR